MFQAYAVGVNLALTGNLDGALRRLTQDMTRFASVVNKANAALDKMRGGLRGFDGAARQVDGLTRSMERMHKAANVTIRAPRVEAAAARAAPMHAAPAGGGGGRHGYDSRVGGFVAAGEMQQMGRATLGLAGDAFQRGMNVEHLRMVMMADQRVKAEDANRALESAYAATKSAPGTTLEGNMQALIDLKSQIGSLAEAEQALPAFARATALIQSMDAKQGIKSSQTELAARAMDIMNSLTVDVVDPKTGAVSQKIDPAQMQSTLDKMTRAYIATGGRVDPQMYLGFAKQARTAGMMLSDEFIYEKMPAIMDSTGGHRAGTALMSMMQVFSKGGTLTDKNYQKMVDLGLASAGGYVEKVDPKTGKKKKSFERGEIFDLPMMFEDPLEWMSKAKARMASKGIQGTEEQILAMLPASQRSTIAGFLADLAKDEISIRRGQENIRNVRPDVAQHMAQNDPIAKMQQLQAAWDKLLATFGGAAMDSVIGVLNATTDALNRMGEWARANPELAGHALEAATALGALAVALGTLSAAVLAFGPALWALGKLGPALTSAGAVISGEAAAAATVIGGAATGIGAAIAGMGAAATAALGGLLYYYKDGGIAHGAKPPAPPPGSTMGTTGMDLPGMPGEMMAKPPRGAAAPNPAPPPNATLGPRSDAGPVSFRGNLVTPDGRTLGQFAAQALSRDMGRPRAGTTGVDLRMGALA